MLVLLAAGWVGACGATIPVADGGAAQRESANRATAARSQRCDLVAARDGSDSGAGTLNAPLRTPQRMADRLRPGQTGCLRAGTYGGRGRPGYVLRFRRGGRRGAPVTVRSFPGERARLAGVVYVPQGANHVTLAHLVVDDPTPFAGGGQITVQIDARDTVLDSLDITNHGQKTCVILGSLTGFGTAVRTVVRDSVLHDCGSEMRDHALYVSNSRRARIVGNVIWRAGGYGVHLFPAARRTYVRSNVIADNGGGVIFAGDGAHASSGNVVAGNVIAGSTRDFNVAVYWEGRAGTRNAARDNCLFAGSGGNVEGGPGFLPDGNVVADPRFSDRAAHDYRPTSATPCTRLVGADVAARALLRPPAGAAP